MKKIIRYFFMGIFSICAIAFAFNGEILSVALSAAAFASLMPSIYEKFNQKDNKKLKILLPIFLTIALFCSMPKVKTDGNEIANEENDKNEVYTSKVIENSTKEKEVNANIISSNMIANASENQKESTDENDITTKDVIQEKGTSISPSVKSNDETLVQQKNTDTSVEKNDSISSTYVSNPVSNSNEVINYNGQTVYITPKGEKYHYLSTCGGKNSRETDLDSAKTSGYTPCKKCVH